MNPELSGRDAAAETPPLDGLERVLKLEKLPNVDVAPSALGDDVEIAPP
jgi:hypothetical protein